MIIRSIDKKPILVVTILSLFLLSGCLDSSVEIKGEDFTFITLDGEEKHLSDFYGKIIVLDLMGVNCGPCFNQMFELKSVSENYSSDDVTIISIDVWITYGETSELLQSYLEYFNQELGIDLDWIFGVDDTEGSIQNKYATSGVPTLYILNKNGKIKYTNVGYEEYSTLASEIDKLLS